MKKKRMLLILTAALALSALSAVGLTACDGGGELTHGHSYTEEIVAPTCTEKGYTVHTCSCGDSYKDDYTDMIEHDYLDGVCKYCGELKDALQLSLSDDGTSYIVSDFISGAAEVVIPSSYRGLPVTAIGYLAFSDCRELTSITIPDSVTSIEHAAFSGCTGLTSVTIPDSVTSIGGWAFSGCTGLTSITIPDSVTSIDYDAFSGCTGLTSITIPDSVTSIGESAFSGCTGLTSVVIPDGVTSIGVAAFAWCENLTSVVIPDSVTIIDFDFGNAGVFEGCTGLKSLTSPYIGDGTALFGISKDWLGTLTMTMTITSGAIGWRAFLGCTGLTSVVISDGVTSIGESAFGGCTDLTSVTIPDSVTSIGHYAFSGCTGLTSVSIPDSVTSIGENAFYDCSSLTSVTIPDSVTSIGGSAFSGCTGLTSITIPDSVTSIGKRAFCDCTGLTSVVIPDSVTSIGYYAFRGCTGLTSIIIPDSVTSIGAEAFYSCGLTEITIPGGISVDTSAFAQCDLNSVYYKGTFSEYLSSYVIFRCHLYIWNGTEYVEPNSAAITRDQIYSVSGIPSIKEITLLYESDVSSVNISDMPSLEKLNLEYFEDEIEVNNVPADVQVVYGYNCKSGTLNGFDYAIRGGIAVLTAYDGTAEQVILPAEIEGAAVTKLGAVFKGNTAVKEVIIPEGYTEIADEAFYGCTALQLLYIPSTITKMGQNVLCDNNMPIYFGNTTIAGQLKLAPYAIYSGFESEPSEWPVWRDKAYITHYNSKFDAASSMIYEETGDGIEITRYCGTAESVVVPAQINGKPVISVGGDGAFFERTYVKEVTISEGITTIGQVAFAGAGLTSITVSEGVTSISPFAFYGCTALAEVSLPQSLGQIGQEAFENCTSLTSVTIPADVRSIAYYAFKGCSALSSVTFEGTDGWILLEMKQDGNAIIPTEKTATPDLSDPSVNATYLKNTYLFWVWMNQDKLPA